MVKKQSSFNKSINRQINNKKHFNDVNDKHSPKCNKEKFIISKKRTKSARIEDRDSKYTNNSKNVKRDIKTDPNLVYGINTVLECLMAKTPSSALYVSKQKIETDAELNKISQIIDFAKKASVKVIPISVFQMNEITGIKTHQGVALSIKPYSYYTYEQISSSATKLLILDGITDTNNFGAIIRSAAAFGVDGIVISKSRTVNVNATTYKTSVGTINKTKIIRVSNLNYFIEKIKKENFFVVGLEADGDKTLNELDLKNEKVAIVVGSENKGISHLLSKNCDFLASIPMKNSVESLNVSVATAIALYALN